MEKQTERTYSRHTIYGPQALLPKSMKKYRAMSTEEHERYCDKVCETGGFDVDDCPGSMPGRIVPISPGSFDWEIAELAAEQAALTKDEGKSVEYKQLIKANMQPISGILYYLTFTGIELKDHAEKLYRAKVWVKPVNGIEMEFFEEIFDSQQNAQEMREEITALLSKVAKKKPELSAEPNPPKRVERKVFELKHKQLHFNGFCCLLKEIRRQNLGWKYARVRKAASKKWRSSNIRDRLPYLRQAEVEYGAKVDLIIKARLESTKTKPIS